MSNNTDPFSFERDLLEGVKSTYSFLQSIPYVKYDSGFNVDKRIIVGECGAITTPNDTFTTTEDLLLLKSRSFGRCLMRDMVITSSHGFKINTLSGVHHNGVDSLYNTDHNWLMISQSSFKRLLQDTTFEKYLENSKVNIFFNNFIPDQNSFIVAGKFDGGSQTRGCSLVYFEDETKNTFEGIQLERVYQDIWRIKYYINLKVWNENDIHIITI